VDKPEVEIEPSWTFDLEGDERGEYRLRLDEGGEDMSEGWRRRRRRWRRRLKIKIEAE